MVIVGRRICCTALVTRLGDRRGLGSGADARGWNERAFIFLLSLIVGLRLHSPFKAPSPVAGLGSLLLLKL